MRVRAKVESLQDWLDLWLETPQEEWAGYDGEEREYRLPKGMAEAIEDEFGEVISEEGVAYRVN